MARASAVTIENSFVKGLITEATGLNFPENACTSANNCVFERIGNVTRRPGIDVEDDFQYTIFAADDLDGAHDACIVEYNWKSFDCNGDRNMIVVQAGSYLHFYEIQGAALSPGHQSFSVHLSDYTTAGSPAIGLYPCGFATGNGVLFVTHPYCEPFFVEWDCDADKPFTNVITIKIRDMHGLDPISYNRLNAQPDLFYRWNERVRNDASLQDGTSLGMYLYNLLNQGWVTSTTYLNGKDNEAFNLGQAVGNNGIGITPVGTYPQSAIAAIDAWGKDGIWPLCPVGQHQPPADTLRLTWPSMAEPWWYYKYPGTDVFDVTAGQQYFPANAPAPMGHFIYNAFDMNRVLTSIREYYANNGGLYPLGKYLVDVIKAGATGESSGAARPSTCAFFAGRMFYSGVWAHHYSGKIYFTKVIETKQDYGICYQVLDPTSQAEGALVASDGGVIVIPEVAKIIKLFSTGANLFVFATNGVWRVGPPLGGAGFAADAYSVTRISTIGVTSSLSFVDVEGMPMWWTVDGIYTLTADQMGTQVAVQSMSVNTIASYLEDVPARCIPFVKGAYNPQEKIVRWVHSNVEPFTFEAAYSYNKMLTYDLVTKSWSPWTITTVINTGPYPETIETARVAGIVALIGEATSTTAVEVTVAGEVVTVDDVPVTTRSGTQTLQHSIFKYTTTFRFQSSPANSQGTFSDIGDTSYLDWSNMNAFLTAADNPEADPPEIDPGGGVGQDYFSNFVTGYKVHGQAIKKFQANLIQLWFNPQDTSDQTFTFIGQYNFSNITAGFGNSRVQTVTQGSRDNGKDYATRRLKVRGHGKALQFRIDSATGKPFDITGWATIDTATQVP